MPRPALGYQHGDQIQNLLGNFGFVMVIHEGRAFMITAMTKWPDRSYTVTMVDRTGKGYRQAMGPGEVWYVTRKDLVNWPQV